MMLINRQVHNPSMISKFRFTDDRPFAMVKSLRVFVSKFHFQQGAVFHSRSLHQTSQRKLSSDNALQELSCITRYGAHDSIVTLDVGGKQFKTLRSTVECNKVLRKLVDRAISNSEGVVFVDRDPTHFGIILQHLRNQADGIYYESMGTKTTTVQLPRDSSKLSDIFVECNYYGLSELQHNLCKTSLLTMLLEYTGGGNSNPFEDSFKLMQRFKVGLVSLFGVVGISNIDSLVDQLPDDMKKAILPQVESLETGAKLLDALSGDSKA